MSACAPLITGASIVGRLRSGYDVTGNEGETVPSECHSADMTAKHSPHVALTEPLIRLIDRKVAEGRHASASEAVRAALRPPEREEAQSGGDAGEDSPPCG